MTRLLGNRAASSHLVSLVCAFWIRIDFQVNDELAVV
jgi:hypothetical protein